MSLILWQVVLQDVRVFFYFICLVFLVFIHQVKGLVVVTNEFIQLDTELRRKPEGDSVES